MLITIDLGNTCMKLGMFNEEQQVAFEIMPIGQKNYKASLLSFIYKAGVRENAIEGVIISALSSCQIDDLVNAIVQTYGIEPIIVDGTNTYGLKINVENMDEIESDILVMCAYGYGKYQKDLLISSLGTNSIFCYVDESGTLCNYVIAPGFREVIKNVSTTYGISHTELNKKESFLATNKADALNVGYFNGYIGMLEYLVNNIKRELGKDLFVVGCGGDSKDVAQFTYVFNAVEPDIVTKGLNYIYRRFYND